MEPKIDVIIVGGGLAGLTSALHLLKEGFNVTLIEKQSYPHHKVCGEYVSDEVLPYLKWLDADPSILHPADIDRLLLTTIAGKELHADLPLGGFGISRYELDHFLFLKCIEKGCTFIQDMVTNITFFKNEFKVSTDIHGELRTGIVIGSYGKRSVLDQTLDRNFMKHKSPWLAVKAHYEGSFPDGLVALHNFNGGYCGVSKIEDNKINICYLADYATFKQHKNLSAYQQKVMYQNKHLEVVFENSNMLFDTPLTISQISFEKKELIEDHILMMGDAAGLIHPLCGNGMAMAIHSAKVCSELIVRYLHREITDRQMLEKNYIRSWNNMFSSRLVMGRILSGILRHERLTEVLLGGLSRFSSLLPVIIKKTHGKPLSINA